jgi:hypothetical protein
MRDEMRELFEAWAINDGRYPKAVERASDGGYKFMKTHTDWCAWQAAWNACTESLEANK